jgi:mRNA interferase YafQ
MTLLITNEGPLGPEWADHPLKGEWSSYRECHAGGDLLLIYRFADEETVIFVRAGSHSELFE